MRVRFTGTHRALWQTRTRPGARTSLPPARSPCAQSPSVLIGCGEAAGGGDGNRLRRRHARLRRAAGRVGSAGRRPRLDVASRGRSTASPRRATGTRAITSIDGVDGRLAPLRQRRARGQRGQGEGPPGRPRLARPAGADGTAGGACRRGRVPRAVRARHRRQADPHAGGVHRSRRAPRATRSRRGSAPSAIVAARGGINAGRQRRDDPRPRRDVERSCGRRATSRSAASIAGPAGSGVFARFGADGRSLEVLDATGRPADDARRGHRPRRRDADRRPRPRLVRDRDRRGRRRGGRRDARRGDADDRATRSPCTTSAASRSRPV